MSHRCGNILNLEINQKKSTIYCESHLFNANRVRNKSRILAQLLCNTTIIRKRKVHVLRIVQILNCNFAWRLVILAIQHLIRRFCYVMAISSYCAQHECRRKNVLFTGRVQFWTPRFWIKILNSSVIIKLMHIYTIFWWSGKRSGNVWLKEYSFRRKEYNVQCFFPMQVWWQICLDALQIPECFRANVRMPLLLFKLFLKYPVKELCSLIVQWIDRNCFFCTINPFSLVFIAKKHL